MSEHEAFDSGEVIYCLCNQCGDTFGSRTTEASTCPKCESRSRDERTAHPPAQTPAAAARNPRKTLLQEINSMPFWLKLATSGVAILIAVLFVFVVTQRPPKPDPIRSELSQAELDRMNRAVEEFFQGAGGVLLLVTALVLYLLPTAIAAIARHRNLAAVILANILLGWTGLGWVLSLIWACMATQHEPPRSRAVSV